MRETHAGYFLPAQIDWGSGLLGICAIGVVVGPTRITATTEPVGPWVSRGHTLTHTHIAPQRP